MWSIIGYFNRNLVICQHVLWQLQRERVYLDCFLSLFCWEEIVSKADRILDTCSSNIDLIFIKQPRILLWVPAYIHHYTRNVTSESLFIVQFKNWTFSLLKQKWNSFNLSLHCSLWLGKRIPWKEHAGLLRPFQQFSECCRNSTPNIIFTCNDEYLSLKSHEIKY